LTGFHETFKISSISQQLKSSYGVVKRSDRTRSQAQNVARIQQVFVFSRMETINIPHSGITEKDHPRRATDFALCRYIDQRDQASKFNF
jgi:hypothetical protein